MKYYCWPTYVQKISKFIIVTPDLFVKEDFENHWPFEVQAENVTDQQTFLLPRSMIDLSRVFDYENYRNVTEPLK